MKRLDEIKAYCADERPSIMFVKNARTDLPLVVECCEELKKALKPFAEIDVDFIPRDEPFRRLILDARKTLEAISKKLGDKSQGEKK